METKQINIPPNILRKLDTLVQKHKNDEEKPPGYSEVVGFLGLKTMTHGQATKIKSFFDNYAPSDTEQKAKHNMYGGNILRNFVGNQIQSIKTKKDISTGIRRMTDYPANGSQTDRTVDRMNSINTKSTEPAKVTGEKSYRNIMNNESCQTISLLQEEIERIKSIMYS